MAEGNTETVEKKKLARTTKKQIGIIVEFLQTNQFVLETKAEPNMLPKIRSAWEDLTLTLNNSDGAKKILNQWKNVVSELKTNVKRKARKMYIDQQKTGGGPPPKPLTELEQKLYDLLAKVSVEGAKEVAEIGLQDATTNVNENYYGNSPAEVNEVNSEINDNIKVSDVIPGIPESSSINRPKATRRGKIKQQATSNNNTLQDFVREQSAALEQLLAKSINLLAESIETLADAIFSFNVK